MKIKMPEDIKEYISNYTYTEFEIGLIIGFLYGRGCGSFVGPLDFNKVENESSGWFGAFMEWFDKK